MTLAASWLPRLESKGRVRLQEPMSRHTTWRVGGPAEALVEPVDQSDLALLLRLAHEEGLALHFIGNGSNLLVSDQGLPGLVVRLGGEFTTMRLEANRLRAGAGTQLRRLVTLAQTAGLSGLEFACGIPATLGGAVVMNAGAAGQSIAEVVRWVRVMDKEGRVETLHARNLSFGYRQSSLQQAGLVLLEVELELVPADPGAIAWRMAEIWDKRQRTQPLQYPTAGSVFKNPPGHQPAGRLIELAGCKGWRVGEAEVSSRHANFIVNLGGARASDIYRLMRQVQWQVELCFGVRLEPEVRILGAFGWEESPCD
ncbi:UDP-N-acetylmuramate dehydrogenase [Desulfothermobacter acidiphilus]|uniref:UDP-N-acetylmuramate dehydrogenase n=1 Tax=Desulfothermobacter acidiphilus TaxID=1938353 RepID=UPI003F8BAA06